MQIFQYRQLFGLSATDMENEPIDQFLTNNLIQLHISKKKELDSKHG